MKGGLVMLNLPLQGEKGPRSRARAEAVIRDILVCISNYHSEGIILCGSLAEPGWLQWNYQRSLGHHSHCVLPSRQGCQLDRGFM